MKAFKIGLILLMLGFASNLFSQNTGSGPAPSAPQHEKMPEEKIKALKIAFLTNALNLTPTEAQAFWPTYNEYQDKKMQTYKNLMELGKKLKADTEKLSDAEINKLLDDYIAHKQLLSNMEVEYFQKFRKVLPPQKVALLQKAERDFKMEVLKEYKKRDGGPNTK